LQSENRREAAHLTTAQLSPAISSRRQMSAELGPLARSR
jgi:hypothetical protein